MEPTSLPTIPESFKKIEASQQAFVKVTESVEKLEKKKTELESKVSELKTQIKSIGEEYSNINGGRLNKTQQGILDRTKEQKKVLQEMRKELKKELKTTNSELKEFGKSIAESKEKIEKMSGKVEDFIKKEESNEKSWGVKDSIKGTRQERAAEYAKKIGDLTTKATNTSEHIDTRLKLLNQGNITVDNLHMTLSTAQSDRSHMQGSLQTQISKIEQQIKGNKTGCVLKDGSTKYNVMSCNRRLEFELSSLKSLQSDLKNRPISLDESENKFINNVSDQLRSNKTRVNDLQNRIDLIMSISPDDRKAVGVFDRVINLFKSDKDSYISLDEFKNQSAKILGNKRLSQTEAVQKVNELKESYIDDEKFKNKLKELQGAIDDYAVSVIWNSKMEGGYESIGSKMTDIDNKINELKKIVEKYEEHGTKYKDDIKYLIGTYNANFIGTNYADSDTKTPDKIAMGYINHRNERTGERMFPSEFLDLEAELQSRPEIPVKAKEEENLQPSNAELRAQLEKKQRGEKLS